MGPYVKVYHVSAPRLLVGIGNSACACICTWMSQVAACNTTSAQSIGALRDRDMLLTSYGTLHSPPASLDLLG